MPGLILPATLALRLGLPQLLRKDLDLGGAPGRANTGDKMMTLVASGPSRRRLHRRRRCAARRQDRPRARFHGLRLPPPWAPFLRQASGGAMSANWTG